jgi:lysophospholipid acyltransferase (LPLAT)-like uncharacterized protein
MGSVHMRVLPQGGRGHPADPSRQRCLYAFWHESVLMAAKLKTRIHILISQHADGELIAQICRHLRLGVVRGSTTRGGGPALRELLRWSRRTHLGLTPDGPRGPRRRVQLGTIFLASHTGLPVVPFGVGFTRAWRARSWDRLAVPYPGSTAIVVIGPEVHVPPGLDREGLERYRDLVEGQMLAATREAEHRALGTRIAA